MEGREQVPVAEMMSPVRCICGGVYDLGRVEVVGRYLDCSVWIAPCCGLKVDDNIFHTRHNFTRITKAEIEQGETLPDGTRIFTDSRGNRMVYPG